MNGVDLRIGVCGLPQLTISHKPNSPVATWHGLCRAKQAFLKHVRYSFQVGSLIQITLITSFTQIRPSFMRFDSIRWISSALCLVHVLSWFFPQVPFSHLWFNQFVVHVGNWIHSARSDWGLQTTGSDPWHWKTNWRISEGKPGHIFLGNSRPPHQRRSMWPDHCTISILHQSIASRTKQPERRLQLAQRSTQALHWRNSRRWQERM